MKKMLLATGNVSVDKKIIEKVAPAVKYNVVKTISFKNELIENCLEYQPDLVIVSKMLGGNDVLLLPLLIDLKKKLPNIRIIFLCGEVDKNKREKINELGLLVLNGIYDFLPDKTIKLNPLANLIVKPRKYEDVEEYTRYLVQSNVLYKDEIIEVEEEVDEEAEQDNPYKKIYMVSSIKPGTGKSFVSTNIATAIAKYGKLKPDGTKLKVAIIEGDLQNLSVGTLLQIEDDKKNLKTVMDKIGSIFTADDSLIDDKLKIQEVNSFIKNSFQQYPNVKNLYALVGSQLKIEELNNINPYYYIYLLESILDEFDVIIIDTNSSLAHITTTPFLQLCNKAFYVINLDYNNIRNNTRYKDTLNNMGVLDKVSYVLNEDLNKEYAEIIGRPLLEDVMFDSNLLSDSGFNVVSAIPELPKEIFNNRLYAGTPIVLDNEEITLKPRLELSKVANEIWEIDNLEWLETEYNKYKEKKLADRRKKKHFF